MKRIIPALFLLMAALTGGCKDNMPPDSGDPVDFRGKVWLLESVEFATGATLTDTAVTLVFSASNQLHGKGPCNTYWGAYTAGAVEMHVSDVRTGRSICTDSDDVVEPAYLGALRSVESYLQSPDRLRLFADGGATVLTYRRVEGDTTTPRDTTTRPTGGDLLGAWRLRTIVTADSTRQVDTVRPIVLRFLRGEFDGRVPVSFGAGASAYGGTYETGADGALTITELHPGNSSHQVVVRYFVLLSDATAYHATEKRLVIYVDPSAMLVFDRAPEFPSDTALFTGITWRLFRMSWPEGGQIVFRIVDTPAVHIFFGPKRYEGMGFCNSYSGDYESSDTPGEGALSIMTFNATEKACRNWLEQKYFAMLAGAPAAPNEMLYEVTAQTLVLASERGTLEYIRQR